jgi:hypothetical protein
MPFSRFRLCLFKSNFFAILKNVEVGRLSRIRQRLSTAFISCFYASIQVGETERDRERGRERQRERGGDRIIETQRE